MTKLCPSIHVKLKKIFQATFWMEKRHWTLKMTSHHKWLKNFNSQTCCCQKGKIKDWNAVKILPMEEKSNLQFSIRKIDKNCFFRCMSRQVQALNVNGDGSSVRSHLHWKFIVLIQSLNTTHLNTWIIHGWIIQWHPTNIPLLTSSNSSASSCMKYCRNNSSSKWPSPLRQCKSLVGVNFCCEMVLPIVGVSVEKVHARFFFCSSLIHLICWPILNGSEPGSVRIFLNGFFGKCYFFHVHQFGCCFCQVLYPFWHLSTTMFSVSAPSWHIMCHIGIIFSWKASIHHDDQSFFLATWKWLASFWSSHTHVGSAIWNENFLGRRRLQWCHERYHSARMERCHTFEENLYKATWRKTEEGTRGRK